MLQTEKILAIVKRLEPKLIEERRHFHIHAEVSCKEYETAAYIISEMKKLGLSPVWVREPVSAYFVFDTQKPGKTIAFRADIDALPFQENEYNLKQKKLAVSQNPGACHACGHDGHTAMLLAVARAIVECKDDLCGKFIFFFESGEEKGSSLDTSTPFVNVLKTLLPDVIWGIHLCSFMDCGKISVQAGARMATSGHYEIKIIGNGGHGSTPHLAVNPLYPAAEIAANIQKNIPSIIPSGEIATIAVTCIQGGDVWNVIPDTALIKGTFRCCTQNVYDHISGQIISIVESACKSGGCTYEYIHAPGSDEFKPVVNDATISAIAEKSLDTILPGARMDEPIWMASESFNQYLQQWPGVFAFLGVENEEKGVGAGHHNQEFDIDEDVLYKGAAASVTFAIEYLKNLSLKGGRKMTYKDYLIKVDSKETLNRQYGE